MRIATGRAARREIGLLQPHEQASAAPVEALVIPNAVTRRCGARRRHGCSCWGGGDWLSTTATPFSASCMRCMSCMGCMARTDVCRDHESHRTQMPFALAGGANPFHNFVELSVGRFHDWTISSGDSGAAQLSAETLCLFEVRTSHRDIFHDWSNSIDDTAHRSCRGSRGRRNLCDNSLGYFHQSVAAAGNSGSAQHSAHSFGAGVIGNCGRHCRNRWSYLIYSSANVARSRLERTRNQSREAGFHYFCGRAFDGFERFLPEANWIAKSIHSVDPLVEVSIGSLANLAHITSYAHDFGHFRRPVKHEGFLLVHIEDPFGSRGG